MITEKDEQATVVTLVNDSTGCKFDFCGRWLRNSPATERDVRLGRTQFRGDKVWLDLPPGVQAQVDKGILRYATAQDEQLREAEIPDIPWSGGGLPMPPGNASHDHWRDYAISRGMTADEASVRTRDQLRAVFLAPGVGRDDAPDLEILEQDPGAREARRR